MNACTDADPERNENPGEEDQAKGNSTRFQTYLPQSRHEGVNGKKLAMCSSIGLKPEDDTRGDVQGW